MKAYILVTAKPGTSEDIVQFIKTARNVAGVKDANSVYGRYDAVIIVEAEDAKSLSELLYKVIEKNPNIIHTETLITLF
ncbi:MAG: Lrp/AsnC ligand binding domain-containing protein [Candidatus Bathyarchaeia archaeon]